MGKLKPLAVKNAKPKVGPDGKVKASRLTDGDGLHLLVHPSGRKSWVLRVTVNGKSRDIGLGSVDVKRMGNDAFGDHSALAETPLMLRKMLTLAEARQKAAALRKLAKAGADPVLERDRERKNTPTFKEATTAAHKALSDGWSKRTADAFLASLTQHAIPKLGAMKVDAIGASDIVLALSPIWTAKPIMAKKVRARIGQVLAFAKARGWRKDSLPDAREMRGGLAKQPESGHFAAMPYKDCPAFFEAEWEKELTASRAAMLFALLTFNRSGAVRQATWEQIDFETREWKCPPDIMKKSRAHDVALNDAAIALLKRLQPDEASRTGLIFRGLRGNPLSDMSLTKILRMAGRSETVHGWRSSFRDWAAERMPHIPDMVPKLAISHKVGNATDQAYLRSQLLEMRRTLFDGWGEFVASCLSPATDNVVPLHKVDG